MGDAEQRAQRWRVEPALAPDDHDVLAAGAQIVGEGSHVCGLRIPRRRVARQRAIQRGQECGLVTGGVAPDQTRVGIQGARPIGGDRQPDAAPAHALADPQVEDRRVVERLAADDQHGMGELEVRHSGLQTRGRQGARELGGHRLARPRVEIPRAQSLAHEALDQETLLVGGLPTDERADRALVTGQAGGVAESALPGDRSERPAVAHEGLGDALIDVDGLVGEAALVAHPAVVDVVIAVGAAAGGCAGGVTAAHPLHLLVADGELDVALRRAQRADAAGALDVPRSGAEPVGPGGERAHRTQLDDVAAERGHVGVAVVGADEGVGGALGEDQLVVLGDLLREAHAAVAKDAPLAVDRNQG